MPFRRGEARSPSNTLWPGARPTSLLSGILIHLAVSPQQTWAENWCVCPFWLGLSPHLIQCGQGRGLLPYQLASWSIQPFGHNIPMSQTGQDRQRSDSIKRTVFSERELVHVRYMLSPVRLSVCRMSSVTLVHPTQAVVIFGNLSTAFGTLAIHWHAQKILWRSSQGILKYCAMWL